MGTRSPYDNASTAHRRKGSRESQAEIIDNVNRRWKNRRWMAWITFVFDHLIILYIILYSPDIGAYESIINTFFMLSGAVLGAYIGFSTWDDVSSKDYRIDRNEGPSEEDQANIDER